MSIRNLVGLLLLLGDECWADYYGWDDSYEAAEDACSTTTLDPPRCTDDPDYADPFFSMPCVLWAGFECCKQDATNEDKSFFLNQTERQTLLDSCPVSCSDGQPVCSDACLNPVAPRCGDDPDFVDPFWQMPCSEWAGFECCSTGATQADMASETRLPEMSWFLSQTERQTLLDSCPESCFEGKPVCFCADGNECSRTAYMIEDMELKIESARVTAEAMARVVIEVYNASQLQAALAVTNAVQLHPMAGSNPREPMDQPGDQDFGVMPTIVVHPGTYLISEDPASAEDAILITRSVRVKAKEPGTVVLDAQGARRAMRIMVYPGAKVELEGVGITGGVPLEYAMDTEGAGIRFDVLEGCTHFGPRYMAGENGGPGFSLTEACRNTSLVLHKCDIYNNHFSEWGNSNGGGLSLISGHVFMAGCRIFHNSAFHGGGINFFSGGNLQLIDCDVFSNYAVSQGGGIKIWGVAGATSLQRCNIHGNEVGGEGTTVIPGFGGYWDSVFGVPTESIGEGAGIYWETSFGRIGHFSNEMVDCSVHNNRAAHTDKWSYILNSRGGGLFFWNSYGKTLVTIRRTHFFNNKAGSNGAGIHIHQGPILLEGCHIYNNALHPDSTATWLLPDEKKSVTQRGAGIMITLGGYGLTDPIYNAPFDPMNVMTPGLIDFGKSKDLPCQGEKWDYNSCLAELNSLWDQTTRKGVAIVREYEDGFGNSWQEDSTFDCDTNLCPHKMMLEWLLVGQTPFSGVRMIGCVLYGNSLPDQPFSGLSTPMPVSDENFWNYPPTGQNKPLPGPLDIDTLVPAYTGISGGGGIGHERGELTLINVSAFNNTAGDKPDDVNIFGAMRDDPMALWSTWSDKVMVDTLVRRCNTTVPAWVQAEAPFQGIQNKRKYHPESIVQFTTARDGYSDIDSAGMSKPIDPADRKCTTHCNYPYTVQISSECPTPSSPPTRATTEETGQETPIAERCPVGCVVTGPARERRLLFASSLAEEFEPCPSGCVV